MYLGCRIQHQGGYSEVLTGVTTRSTDGNGNTVRLQTYDADLDRIHFYFLDEVKLVLKKLSDMTEEEAWDIWGKVPRHRDHGVTNPKCAITDATFHANWSIHDWVIAFPILLSKGFDLFGLLESGDAIDAKTLKP